MMKEVFEKLGGCDGSHRGLTDLYSDRRQALKEAIESSEDFDTGWYSSKHTVANARIRREDYWYTVEANVSDDLDTYGSGSCVQHIGPETLSSAVMENLDEKIDSAWNLAVQDRNENAVYAGYSVGHVDSNGKRKDWIWTYLAPVGFGCEMESPPGDYYHEWGWEYGGINEEEDKLTQEEREGLEKWINDPASTSQCEVGRWIIEPWNEEE